jgi:hypothetical protein
MSATFPSLNGSDMRRSPTEDHGSRLLERPEGGWDPVERDQESISDADSPSLASWTDLGTFKGVGERGLGPPSA